MVVSLVEAKECAAAEQVAGLREQMEALTGRVVAAEALVARCREARETGLRGGGRGASRAGVAEPGGDCAAVGGGHGRGGTGPAGRHDPDRPRNPGPGARAKWLTGSVEHTAPHTVTAVFAQAESRDPRHARTWVVFVDGHPTRLS